MKLEARIDAKALYMSTNWSLKKIAAQVRVGERAVGKWCKDENWKEEKEARALTVHQFNDLSLRLAKKIVERLQVDIDDGKGSPEAQTDALNKLGLHVQRTIGRENSIMYLNAFEGFMPWLQRVAPKLAAELGPHTENFIAEKIADENRLRR
jgi:hypothetical protein